MQILNMIPLVEINSHATSSLILRKHYFSLYQLSSITSPFAFCPLTFSPFTICPSIIYPFIICPLTFSPFTICPSIIYPFIICPFTICPSTFAPSPFVPPPFAPPLFIPSSFPLLHFFLCLAIHRLFLHC
jgi:hypothetical protein